MKFRYEINAMLKRIESEVKPGEMRMALIMALEWIAGDGISTSLGLEDWLAENKGEEV